LPGQLERDERCPPRLQIKPFRRDVLRQQLSKWTECSFAVWPTLAVEQAWAFDFQIPEQSAKDDLV
jgi:hypothetical protein